jgi:hypothetical protein
MSKIEVDAIEPQSGTTLTIGASGDSVNIASGATITDFTSTGIDDNATSTAITIDSSENVHVGKTSTSIATNGVTLGTGVSTFTASGDRPMIINRKTDDGSLIEFYKDDSTSLNLRTISGGLEFSSGSTGYLNILSNGNVGINQTSPTEKLHVTGNTRTNSITNRATFQGIGPTPTDDNQFELGAGYLNLFRDDTVTVKQVLFGKNGVEVGSISTTGAATAYNTSSDYRLKENVNYNFDATTRLKQLKPARFNFIRDADKTVDGFLAHELQLVIPEAITGIKDQTVTKEKVVVNADGNVIAENIEQADWEAGKILNEKGIEQADWEAGKLLMKKVHHNTQ